MTLCESLTQVPGFLVRMPEMIAKLTLLSAISRNPEKPLIRVTRTLHMSDMIEEEWLDGRKVVFTLKNAA